MERLMIKTTGAVVGPRVGGSIGCLAAAILFAVALVMPGTADAAQGGGGGGHGGAGFHGGGGGFRGSGFHGSGFHGSGFHDGGRFHGGGFHRGFVGRNVAIGIGLGAISAPYFWDYGFPDYGYYGYPDYGYQPYPVQYWYYCSDPAGYYPY